MVQQVCSSVLRELNLQLGLHTDVKEHGILKYQTLWHSTLQRPRTQIIMPQHHLLGCATPQKGIMVNGLKCHRESKEDPSPCLAPTSSRPPPPR